MKIDELSFRHLKLLSALLQHRSISEAARALNIPQPTASHGLARLREALNDELLVRGSGGMQPTKRALGIADDVEQILRLKRDLADGGSDFSSHRLEREFVIACSDIGQLLVVTEISPVLKERAPKVRIRTTTMKKSDMVASLESGDIDLAMGAFPRLGGGIKTQTLYQEHYRCFAQPSHPFISSGALSDFTSSDHVVVSTRAMAHAHRSAEQQLIEHVDDGHVRSITSSFIAALIAVITSPMIVTTPGKVVSETAKMLGLSEVTCPLNLDGFDVQQYWHVRDDKDSAHYWLRQLIFKSLAKFR